MDHIQYNMTLQHDNTSNDNNIIRIIGGIDSFLSATALCAHIVGLLSIYLYKKQCKQNLILASLSVAELVTSVRHVVLYWYSMEDHQAIYYKIIDFGNYYLY